MPLGFGQVSISKAVPLSLFYRDFLFNTWFIRILKIIATCHDDTAILFDVKVLALDTRTC